MKAYVIKRVLSALVIMWAVASIVFFAMRVVPADPAQVVLGDYATEETLKAFRHEMGLDRSLFSQYIDFIAQLVRGDLGRSMITHRPVGDQIWALFPYTFNLAISSMLIGAIIGIPLGVWAAIRKNTAVDYISRLIALAGFSFPAFYLGVLLLLVFSVELGWFPIIHQVRTGSITEHIHKLILPALSLGLIQASYVTRLTRSSMLEALNEDYVRTAFAKGLRPKNVYFKHVLKNIMIPVITAIGLYTGTILGGAILTETVFNRPGMGKLLVGAINQRDYTTIQSGLMVFAFIVVIVNLIVDLTYSLFDPKVKYE
ncbi:MAG: ABC transporter permease [Desulfobacteraceae bacterium]|nr:MAG: ABC transporter permease [Desulfobacteraceae bacterium]